MKIELLYFEGCPGFEEALAVLEKTVEEEGLATRVEAIKLDSGDHPDFPGSPTILVDGEDLFPPEERRDLARAQSCRVYQTPEGLKNHPTAGLVREALAERSLRARGGPLADVQPAASKLSRASILSIHAATFG